MNKNPFEGRRRWRAKEPKREAAPNARTLTVSAGLRALIILMFGILVIQLINLQVIHGENYKQQSAINAIREVPTSAARGLIYDREGRPLVSNSARFAATIGRPAGRRRGVGLQPDLGHHRRSTGRDRA